MAYFRILLAHCWNKVFLDQQCCLGQRQYKSFGPTDCLVLLVPSQEHLFEQRKLVTSYCCLSFESGREATGTVDTVHCLQNRVPSSMRFTER